MPCRCTNRDCFQRCGCYRTWAICSPDCNCHGGCLNSVVLRWSAPQPQGTAPTVAPGSSTAQGTSQTQPCSSAAQAAAQMLPSSSVVAPDTKTKALPAREPGSKHKPCRCDKSKCENMYCVCVNAGLPCCDRCECKDCDNTKTSEEKLQDLLENIRLREVPASGSRTCTMTARAVLAAKKSAMGCKCQGECASRCGCVRRNIKCTSKCKCKRCGNDDGSRFPKDVPGGQGGTHSSSSAVESLGKHV